MNPSLSTLRLPAPFSWSRVLATSAFAAFTAACSGGGGPTRVVELTSDSPGAAVALAEAPDTCGCGLCEPHVSDDSCATDADCAPASPCHAAACVAVDKADRSESTCDERVVCASADANRCGCYAGRCALMPQGT